MIKYFYDDGDDVNDYMVYKIYKGVWDEFIMSYNVVIKDSCLIVI